MMSNLVFTAVFLSLLCTVPGWPANAEAAPSSKALLEKADRCAKRLYGSKDKVKYRHHWTACVDTYREVGERYPKSEEAPWALYRGATMLLKLYGYSGRGQDLDDAVELYRRVANGYVDHRLADDAQYQIGEIYHNQKDDLTQAYLEFLKVELRYPKGDMKPRAQKMIEKLTAVISQRENQKEIQETLSKAPGLTQVQAIRHWSTPNYTRVVIDLERAVPFQSNLLKENKDLKKPRRLYLDLEGTYVSSEIESPIPIRDGLLRSARAGQYTKDTVRVVLDIDNIENHKIFPLHDPFRIVIDVRGAETKEEAKEKEAPKQVAKAASRPARRGIRKAKTPDKSVSLARQLGLNVRKIVIDPGHGGKDPGCFFNGGFKEKDVVLMLAQILADKVEDQLGLEALLTREEDVFMPLEKRTAFANMHKADLFISLHINAHKQAEVHGLETYYLNMATDERAVLVAARENATSEKNISDLQSILNDLMLNTKISESSKLAHEVQKGIMGNVGKTFSAVRDLGVKQAPFYVLIGAEMPAVLVETGFITNPAERKRLQSRKYLETMADGIVAGLEGYIRSLSRTARGG
jgi:N-acetylmuramoyl-L-alanine amidase